MLSPLDLKNKKIETKKKKYDKAQMDEYLDLVFENYKALYDEYETLKKDNKNMEESIKYYRSIESTMQKALVLAEKTSKETKDAALLKAEAIEKDANIKAEQIIADAEKEYDNIREKCLLLMDQFNQYKKQLKQVTTAQLELITGGSFEVEGPIIKNELNHPLHISTPEPTTKKDTLEETQEIPVVTEPLVEEPEAEEVVAEVIEEPENEIETIESEIENVEEAVDDTDKATEEVASEEDFEDSSEIEESNQPEEVEDTATTEENIDKTMIIPDLKDSLKEEKEEPSEEETIDILTADTIDLSDSINQVKKTTEPIPEGFEYAETKVAESSKPEQLEPVKEVKEVPTLDSLLQSMNMSKKKKGKKGQDEDDPFEFLGSVDDF